MMEKCFDEGTIQAFLDGELAQERVEQVSRHIALCDACAVLIAEAEQEMALTFSALDRELDALVPTQRLWTKINRSIEEQARSRSVWQTVFEFLTSPTSVAFASLLIVFGLFVGLYQYKSGETKSEGDVARNTQQPKKPIPQEVLVTNSPAFPPQNDSSDPGTDAPQTETPQRVASKPAERESYRIERADHRTANRFENKNPNIANEPKDVVQPVPLVAEESYLRTIDTLEKTVDGRKDAVMNPSSRFAYEKDMALANATIERLKKEVERNPKNTTARELLRTSYQNKIDLLNSVAEKNELMASLN
ncbi:MAG: zf-HC2 domain-containing protein [Pyrinomonadaceae bacterium]